MGEEIETEVAYDQGNQYERLSTWLLNEEILGCEGLLSIDIELPQQLSLTEDQRRRMRQIIRENNQRYLDWGFKDPRTSLVYELWKEELPEHKIIVVYRSLDEVWQRYRPEIHRRYRDFGVARKLVQRWSEHNASILKSLDRAGMPYIVLDYSRMMKDDQEFNRLQEFLGRKLVDRRRKDLYRHRQAPTSFPLEMAKWFLKKQVGLDTQQITAQLEDCRESKVYA